MGELGVRSDVIERCLNHIGEDRLKKIYQRQELMLERAKAFEKLGERLQQLAHTPAPKPAVSKPDSITPHTRKTSSWQADVPAVGERDS